MQSLYGEVNPNRPPVLFASDTTLRDCLRALRRWKNTLREFTYRLGNVPHRPAATAASTLYHLRHGFRALEVLTLDLASLEFDAQRIWTIPFIIPKPLGFIHGLPVDSLRVLALPSCFGPKLWLILKTIRDLMTAYPHMFGRLERICVENQTGYFARDPQARGMAGFTAGDVADGMRLLVWEANWFETKGVPVEVYPSGYLPVIH
jgi:hypothetical protein